MYLAARRALTATLAGGVAGALLLTSVVVANAAPLHGASAQQATKATPAITLSSPTATLADPSAQPEFLGALAESVANSVVGAAVGAAVGAYVAAKLASPAAEAAAEESSSSSSSSSSSGNAQTYYNSNAGDPLEVQFNAPVN